MLGVACLGLNGGPAFKHNEAFSFQVATEDQGETDRYWNAIVGNGGQCTLIQHQVISSTEVVRLARNDRCFEFH